MNWTNEPATENQRPSLGPLAEVPSSSDPPVAPAQPGSAPGRPPPAGAAPEIKIGKRHTVLNGKEAEVFTMTLGIESVELLPFRNWGQLDVYKWTMRGKLPGTPAGLDITLDHVKLSGEIVSTKDPEGSPKLEKLFQEWLELERETLELAKKKAQAKAAPVVLQEELPPEQRALHFQVEVDKKGQVHIHSVQGKEILATIGLNAPGFQSLVSQGLMRKPHALKTGALHDWVELDGVLFSFEKGNNDAESLARALNDSYLPASALGTGKEVVVYANAASSTGFDIQFPAKVGGLTESRRRPLIEDALDILQDPDHCGLLRTGLVVKLTRPNLIFKLKTPDGGERYLERSPENVVKICTDDEEKVIDLSQPVNYMHLSAMDLTAVFNHPAINRHSKAGAATNGIPSVKPVSQAGSHQSQSSPSAPAAAPLKPELPRPAPQTTGAGTSEAKLASPPAGQATAVHTLTAPPRSETPASSAPKPTESTPLASPGGVPAAGRRDAESEPKSQAKFPGAQPNQWLKPILEKQAIRFDWFACVVYSKIANYFHDSREATIDATKCWLISLTDVEDLTEPAFKGIFLADDGTFGFFGGGCKVQFQDGGVQLQIEETVLRSSDVRLHAVAMENNGLFVFVVGEGFSSKFGVPDPVMAVEMSFLKERGVVLRSTKQVLASHEPIEVIWTVPVEQTDPADPQAVETSRPVESRP